MCIYILYRIKPGFLTIDCWQDIIDLFAQNCTAFNRIRHNDISEFKIRQRNLMNNLELNLSIERELIKFLQDEILPSTITGDHFWKSWNTRKMPDASPYRQNEAGKSKEMVEMMSNKRKKMLSRHLKLGKSLFTWILSKIIIGKNILKFPSHPYGWCVFLIRKSSTRDLGVWKFCTVS